MLASLSDNLLIQFTARTPPSRYRKWKEWGKWRNPAKNEIELRKIGKASQIDVQAWKNLTELQRALLMAERLDRVGVGPDEWSASADIVDCELDALEDLNKDLFENHVKADSFNKFSFMRAVVFNIWVGLRVVRNRSSSWSRSLEKFAHRAL